MQTNSKSLPYLFLVLAPLFWVGNFLMGRLMHGDIPPFTFAFYRWLLVILILLPLNYSTVRSNFREIKQQFWPIVVLSLLSIVIYTSFVYLGLHFTSVVNASLINAIVPVFMTILTYFVLGEKITINKLLGIMLSLLGVSFIITKGHVGTVSMLHLNQGDVVILIAAGAWALFSVLYKKLSLKIPPFSFLLITAIIGDIILFPGFLLERYNGSFMEYNMTSISTIAYAATFSSVLAFTFWNIGVRAVGPAIASHFFNLLPIFASVLAILFLGENLHVYHLIGITCVFSGIYLVTQLGNESLRDDRTV